MTMTISPLDRLLLELLAERDRMRHGRLELGDVELALPAAYDDGGDAVADEVRQRPALAHELVDADQDGKRLNRDVGHDRQRRRQRDEARAGHARRALGRDHGDGQDAELLANAERRVWRLPGEERPQRHVTAGSAAG